MLVPKPFIILHMVLVQLTNSICNLARLKKQTYSPEEQTWLASAHSAMKDEKSFFFLLMMH